MTTSRKTVYTTGEVAKLCQVAPRTVTKWFDAGKLRGYRIPGNGRERRIYRDSVQRFLVEHGMLDQAASSAPHLVVASNDPHLIDTLRRSLEPRWVVAVAGDWFELGRLANDSLGAVVLDFSFGTRGDMLSAVRWFAGRAPKPRILALLNEDECGPCEVLSAGADLAHARPADPHQLALALEPKVGAA